MNPLDRFIREDITPQAKIVNIYLESLYYRYGKCLPRQATIASDLHISRRTVIRCIKELRDKEFIVSKRLASTCRYFPVNDVTKSVYINKQYISKLDISRPDISRHDLRGGKVRSLIQSTAKNNNIHYRSAVQQTAAKKARVPKAQKDKLYNFLKNLSSDRKKQFWDDVMKGDKKWLKQFPQLG
jgi:DNA-binding transcriptional MocR family regulator